MSFLSLPDSSIILEKISSRHQALLVFTYWNATPHLETDYEIILTLLSRDCHVYHLDLSDHLPVKTCTHPGTRTYRDSIHSLFSAYKQYTHIEPGLLLADHEPLPFVRDLEDYSTLSYRGINVGPCLKSYIIDQLRTSTPTVQTARNLAKAAFETAAMVVNCLELLFSRHIIDALVTFNGRYPAGWAASEYFRCHKKNIYFHERGATIQEFQLLDHMAHDYYAWNQAYSELYTHSPYLSAKALASAKQWIANKLNKSDQQTVNFGQSSVVGLLKDISIPSEKLLVSYFTVSFDEWSSLPSSIYPRSTWPDEYSVLQAILSAISRHPRLHLAIRVHPNNLNKDLYEQDRIHNMAVPGNVTIIPASSPVDSYELISQSHSVFTYGSSIGYEAVYLGYPVYIFGRCFYDNLDYIQNIKSYADLVSILSRISTQSVDANQPRSSPPRESNYYYYAYLRQQGSLPFRYYHPLSMHMGSFLGIPATYIYALQNSC
jgi:hypothetical protein